MFSKERTQTLFIINQFDTEQMMRRRALYVMMT
jgi:hypothetical protein